MRGEDGDLLRNVQMFRQVYHILELCGFLVQNGGAEFWADAERNRDGTPGHRSLRQKGP